MPPTGNKQQDSEVTIALMRARATRDSMLRSIKKLMDIAKNSVGCPEKRLIFEARLLPLEQFVTDFNIEQKNILSILAECDRLHEFEEQDEEVTETMQAMCGEINAIATSWKTNSITIPTSHIENNRTSMHSLILPRIEIPKFDGNVSSWCSFRDMFKSLVHENNAYSNIERFHCLVSYLSGPALTVVKAVPLTADNYSIAWNTLQNCYENQCLLVTAHLERLFAFAPLTKESATSLLSFVNTFRKNVAAVKAFGVKDLAEFILFYIGLRVIDPVTRRLFEASVAQNEIPTLDILLEFVSQRCKILENVGSNYIVSEGIERTRGRTETKKIKGGRSGKTSLAATAPMKTVKCLFCEHPHAIYKCFAFRKKSVVIRREFATKNKLCFICLNTGHISNSCPTSFTCRVCSGKHNTLLHLTAATSQTVVGQQSETSERTSPDKAPQFAGTIHTDTTVLLGTVIVRVCDSTGVARSVRAVLDCGSQVSAMTSECVNRLGLTRRKCSIEITGLSQQPISNIKGQTRCSFFPTQSDLPEFKANNVIILPYIMSPMPTNVLPAEVRERYRHLILADPQFDRPAPVDMLIGGDLYLSVMQTKADIIHTVGLPSAISTHLGWVVIGALKGTSATSLISLAVSTSPPIEEVIQRFWAVEEPIEAAAPTTLDRQCEEWFARTVTRNSTGRFYVDLPFRTIVCSPTASNNESHEDISVGLGSSKNGALNRLYNLERRLAKDQELYEAYRNFMDNYIALGHMRVAVKPGKYFIPHQSVVKRDTTGIKIRVVFDASTSSSSGTLLNDCLVTGLKLQTEISDVLLLNRLRKFVFTADIAKMYRQIRIHEQDRSYQHILWRRSPNEEVCEYELCTFTYGVSSAPFLAIRCLRQLDQEDGHAFSLAKNILVTDTYVDDIFVGADSLDEILEMQRQVIWLLKRGGFELKKWASNCPEILTNIGKDELAITPWMEPNKEQAVKVLGVHWDTIQNTFGYLSTIGLVQPKKRFVLSTVARLYDPFDALGPMIFWAKCLIQRLWVEKLDWDVPSPTELASIWLSFVNKFTALSQLSLPRYIAVNKCLEIQLVGFADASQKGYAATVFLRVLDSQGSVQVYFVACKTKVAPLKFSHTDLSLTIPRLELCAAFLLARLMSQRLQILKDQITIPRVRAWTDSTIVLAWLTAEQKLFKIFVTNRVAKIQELLPQCEWAHVDTTENSADPASRDLLPDALVTCTLFMQGVKFLYNPEDQWPSVSVPDVKAEQLPEYEGSQKRALIIQTNDCFIKRFSELRRMQRVLAYCLGFADYVRQRSKTTGPISWRESENVLMKLAKYTQQIHYTVLLKQLTNPALTVTPNTSAQLAPFVDSQGIIGVGGRLRHSALSTDAKHLMILPKVTHLTQLIIHHYHHNTLHGETLLTLSLIHRRFWIVSGRAAVRQVIFKCILCTKYKAVTPQPVMADLSLTRVQSHRPFINVGLDYGGHFSVKESRRRNAKSHKAYLAVFVCLCTKAIHLEVVSDLSTEAFMAALDRFMARRGIPVQIQTDCGTNYIGAARQLKKLFQEAAMQETLHSRVPCQWKLNPPATPHFGEIWEAVVKCAKIHLKRVIGTQIYSLDELMTLIIRVEGVLNYRPFVAMSNDPNDMSVLTPGRFLIGQPVLAIPEHDVLNGPQNLLKRWQLMRQTFQSFWKRWYCEYFHTLQGRQKWYLQNSNLNVGDMVFINSPSRPPMAWQLGRVTNVHPGPDNVVRVATVKTAEGSLKRPVVKLVKLPMA